MRPGVTSVYTLEITSADPGYLLTKISSAGITVFNIRYLSELKLQMCVHASDFPNLMKVMERCGDAWRILSESGLMAHIRGLRKRTLLVMCILMLLGATIFIPTRILFVTVEGNTRLSDTLILDQAEACGITFGASRSAVRSEKMKNALLLALPNLKWAGINTSGCTAVISVLERETEDTDVDVGGVNGIAAIRDGIVCDLTVTRGTALCQVGQAVHAGEMLISGYSDRGLVTRAEQAQGEIRAITNRQLQAVVPNATVERADVLQTFMRFKVLIGKKEIKLYNDSGNPPTGCGKIYHSYDLTLPGGFKLPLTLIVEKVNVYSMQAVNAQDDHDIAALQDLARRYVLDTMIAGQIVDADVTVDYSDDFCYLKGNYACVEMIGKVQKEEIR